MPNNTLSKVWGGDIKPLRAKDIARPKKKTEPVAPAPAPVSGAVFDGSYVGQDEKTKGGGK